MSRIKELLIDELGWSSAPEEENVRWVLTEWHGDFKPAPSSEDILSLTQPIKPDEQVRSFCPDLCREWALKNWERIIQQAKEVLLDWAWNKKDDQFIKAIEKIEQRFQ